MSDIEALAAKLREAEETNRQLEARLKEVEEQRDRYGAMQFLVPDTKDEWISVAEWCNGNDRMVEEYTKGPVYPFDDLVREIEERVRAGEFEPHSKDAREPAA
jgi:hypothetical protein